MVYNGVISPYMAGANLSHALYSSAGHILILSPWRIGHQWPLPEIYVLIKFFIYRPARYTLCPYFICVSCIFSGAYV